MRGVRRWLRLRSVERDLDEELAFHREERLRELEADGLTPAAARAEADRLFGDERRYRRELLAIDRAAAVRERWRVRLQAVADVVRHAARSLLRTPALTCGIVVAFGLGIGANATMFGTVERLLLRPPAHVEDPGGVRRLLIERVTDPSGPGTRRVLETMAWPDVVDFMESSSFAHVAGYAPRSRTAGRGADAEQISAVMATSGWWPLLGVRPALGRFYTAEEDAVGAEPVAVIGHGYWQRQYGGRADVLGSRLELGDAAYTIIGVAPAGFTGVDLAPVDAFLPLLTTAALELGTDWLDSRNWHFVRAVARLGPGVAAAAAEAEATTRHRAGRAEHAHYGTAEVIAAPLLAARGPNAPAEATVARWLLGVAGIVLLIASLNVANLLLARTIRQSRETSIRLAIGISRRRLIAQVLAEGAILGLLGGAAALVVAGWGGTQVQRLLLPDVGWESMPTRATLLLVAGLALVAGCGAALAAAVQASRRDTTTGLRTSAGGISRSTARARGAMAAVQAMLSVLLLIGAGLFVRSLQQVRAADLGMDPWEVGLVTPQFERGALADGEDLRPFHDAALQRVRNLPSVAAATAAVGIPFYSSYAYSLSVPGLDSVPRSPAGGSPEVAFVDPGYFGTLRLEVLRGRPFTHRDDAGAPHVVVLGAAFAQALWPGQDPLGRCIRIRGPEAPCAEVVGVVADARTQGIVGDLAYQYYAPLAQNTEGDVDALLVRSRGDLHATLRDVQAALLAADPRIRYLTMRPLDDLLAPELRKWHLGAALFTLFGLLALIVAATGLYSLLAFDVAQRTREIGLRTVLGATRNGIVRMVAGRALRLVLLGAAAGAAAAFVLTPRLQPLLYGVGPRDPLTFAAVLATLVLVAAIAAAAPARRAARLDPGTALRTEA